VSLQAQEVLRGFDIVAEAGGSRRGVMKEFKNTFTILTKKERFPSNSNIFNILRFY